MEDLNQGNLQDRQSRTLQRIDQTLARSRKVVQESIQLTKKTVHRRIGDKENQRTSNLPFSKPSDSFYQKKIQNLTKKLQNEQNLKRGYQSALQQVRGRIIQIEQKNFESKPLNCQSAVYKKQQERNGSLPLYSQAPISLLQQNESLKQKLLQIQTLHRQEIQNLHIKLESLSKEKQYLQQQYNKLLQEYSQEGSFQQKYYMLKDQIGHMNNELTNYRDSSIRIQELQQQISELEDKSKKQIAKNKELHNQIKSKTPSVIESITKENTLKIRELENQMQIARRIPKNDRSSSNKRMRVIRNKSPFSNRLKRNPVRQKSFQKKRPSKKRSATPKRQI